MSAEGSGRLAARAAAAYVGVVGLGVARRRIRLADVAAGFVALPVAVIAGVLAVAFLSRRGGASALGAVPLLVVQLMMVDGLFNGLNLRLAAYLMVPVLLAAGALVPLAAQVLDRGPAGQEPGSSSADAAARPMPS